MFSPHLTHSYWTLGLCMCVSVINTDAGLFPCIRTGKNIHHKKKKKLRPGTLHFEIRNVFIGKLTGYGFGSGCPHEKKYKNLIFNPLPR
jgi:hypothetical protein